MARTGRQNLWRGQDDRSEVFSIFTFADLDKALAFISAPDEARRPKG
jgi:hypothetical protein